MDRTRNTQKVSNEAVQPARKTARLMAHVRLLRKVGMSVSRGKLALAGGILITASGLVSIWVGGRAGYLVYEPDPGRVFGHVGILAGLAAIVIGGVLIWISPRKPTSPFASVALGLLTVFLGHLGAIAGALLVGTAGMVLCYIAGIWAVASGLRVWRGRS